MRLAGLRDRAALEHEKLALRKGPFDVLRGGKFSLDGERQFSQRLQLPGIQDLPLPGRLRDRPPGFFQHKGGWRGPPGDQRLPQAGHRFHQDFLISGERVDGEHHPGNFRRNLMLHDDPHPGLLHGGELPVFERGFVPARGPARLDALHHLRVSAHVQVRGELPGKGMFAAVLRRPGGTHRQRTILRRACQSGKRLSERLRQVIRQRGVADQSLDALRFLFAGQRRGLQRPADVLLQAVGGQVAGESLRGDAKRGGDAKSGFVQFRQVVRFSSHAGDAGRGGRDFFQKTAVPHCVLHHRACAGAFFRKRCQFLGLCSPYSKTSAAMKTTLPQYTYVASRARYPGRTTEGSV